MTAPLQALGYSKRVLLLVGELTRRPGVSYMSYVRSIAKTSDRGLIAIKLADNADNSDPARIAMLPEAERSIVERYRRAREVLDPAFKAVALC